ncbi:MAG: UDP-2,3-diacylglucosamine diphosphatase, partial [Burkholderiaceae bacterium]|nr:UDP-2,3-diacylglucosamine diphosphatase [Burkholderiaceae bacterium]
MALTDPVPALAAQADRVDLAAPVFISDLHLNAAQPATRAAFARFVHEVAPRFAELVILGDLFEYWAGDDDDDATGREVAALLKALAGRGTRVFVMHGNRDLLLGRDFCAAAGATLLADPTLARIGSGEHAERVLLSHGDAWCTRDAPYMQFRAQARNPAFQAQFLSQPLLARRAFIGQARAASEAGKASKAMDIMDVTPDEVEQALRAAGVTLLIHGHTHRPDTHRFALDGQPAQRWVLPDWDRDASTPRGGYLSIAQ